jgi:hypothetical protein
MQIGDIDVTKAIINLQSKVFVLEQVLNYIVEKNPNIERPNNKTMEMIRDNAFKSIKELYPNMNIKRRS